MTSNDRSARPPPGRAAAGILSCLAPASAALAGTAAPAGGWSPAIVLLVLAVSAAGAALPAAAAVRWPAPWRAAAAAPLALLAVWIAASAVSAAVWPGSRRMWPLELFAWTMLSMVYMSGLIAVKRRRDKRGG